MPVTKEAKRKVRIKVLNRQLKEQKRNVGKVERRISKIEKELWEIEVEKLKDTGLLQKLTWEYSKWIRLFGCTAIGIRCKENREDNKVVQELQKWFWKYSNSNGCVRIHTKVVEKYAIQTGMSMATTDDDDYSEARMIVEIYTIDVDETGTGHSSEKKALKTFAKKWGIEVDLNE